MGKGREKGCGRLSVFKGREARLNRAIFHILALKGPQTIYKLAAYVKQQKFLRRRLYSVINRRVRALEQLGYIENIGETKTKAGFEANLYQLTFRAYLATLLNQINMDKLVEDAQEDVIASILTALLAHYEQSHFNVSHSK